VRSARDAAKLGAEVFALPARIAARLRRRLVIAMDEFQAIADAVHRAVSQHPKGLVGLVIYLRRIP
jgi:hypothetical protein